MAEYKLVDVEIPKEVFKDHNGNEWITAVFEGFGEPVKWVVKDSTKIRVGETYQGEIKDWTSTKGKTMPRFYRDNSQGGSSNYQPKREYKDNSDGQRQGMCINNAAEYVKSVATTKLTPNDWALRVHEYADALYSLGDLGVQANNEAEAAEMRSLMESLPAEDDMPDDFLK